MNRRDFLRAGVAGGAFALTPLGQTRADVSRNVWLVTDKADSLVASGPAQWAIGELSAAVAAAGGELRQVSRVGDAGVRGTCVIAGDIKSALVAPVLRQSVTALPSGPESFAISWGTVSSRSVLVAAGADTRGFVYALLELTDRLRQGLPIAGVGSAPPPIVETPANPVRSVMRQFTCETLDKPWFYDREGWSAYLSMLATHRFNRLHLAFGLGYDSLQSVVDSYLLFLYPFLLSVPGYDVRMTNLLDTERDRNLETLRFVSDEAAKRGLECQLGVWMHGYALANSPRARYVVEGLTPDTQAAYCRDALTAVLKACPNISAVALRIHGESGVAEGSYDFWATVFDGVRRAGRRIEIDLHAKGIDDTMINRALDTGLPVNVSPKYWAEHLGLPYHQAAIRELEMPVEGRTGRGLMALSEGARVFTRYGYADLMRDDRRYTIRHRIFAGTQKLLLSGDPGHAAAYARAFQFCGSTGVDLMEPLTCRGRRGSASAAPRDGYTDAHLETRWDWQKYSHWYRTWGRFTFNPETAPDVGAREFASAGSAGVALASAIAKASRILPLVTTAHLPSAACDSYWPEVYWNQSIVDGALAGPYTDTPQPRTFPNVSPLDPQVFSSMSEHARARVAGAPDGKYSPIEVAAWLEDLASGATADLARAGQPSSLATRRAAIDVELLAQLGAFFAAKFRAGVLFAIHEQTTDRRALEEAVAAYEHARGAWARVADRANGVYADDLAAGEKVSVQGAWGDRLAAIDADIERLRARLGSVATGASDPRVAAAVAAALARPSRPSADVRHVAPPEFRPGDAVPVLYVVAGTRGGLRARLFYRHVNQAEHWQTGEMTVAANRVEASIPAAYTNSPYPLQYYVEFADARGAWLFPALGPNLDQPPYFMLTRSR